MALRRLGWTATTPEGVKVNDRIVRMAQEQAGRALRSAKWRADLTAGVLSTWPAEKPAGWQADRDHGAWRRIAARGLTHQAKTVTDRTNSAMMIRSVVDTLEATAVVTPPTETSRRKDRSKTSPTRPHTSRPAPRRRRAPSPTRPHSQAGKRPERHAPTDRTRLPRAAHRHQDVNTINTPTTGHQPRGAALGAGFHLRAHATPPRWETIPEAQSDSGSIS
ncbi:hypothetical protein [Micromonospora sp. NPDC050200]|uniref:hypothetical protein n=1 Tax=Micromonospora sp. NPDC050200 TaxID=3155664 RepID=UPI0033E435B2